MWFWFVFWIVILLLLFSGGGYYGYRRSFYGQSSMIGLLISFLVLAWIAVLFAGPYWGYYGYWW